MDQKLSDKIIQAFDTHFNALVEDYRAVYAYPRLHAAKKEQSMLNLLLTCKYWADPNNLFQPRLNPAEILNCKALLDVLALPSLLLPEESKSLNENDLKTLSDLLKQRLNQLSDGFIEKYNLKTAVAAAIPKIEDVETWWQGKSQAEQNKIKADYEKYAQKKEKDKLSSSVYVIDPFPNQFYWYFLLLHHHDCHARSHVLPIGNVFSSSIGNSKGSYSSSGGIGKGFSGVSSSHSGGNGKLEGAGLVVAILGVAVLAGASMAAAASSIYYAAAKLKCSLSNILSGKKGLRSAFRIAGIGAGGYGGFVAGASIGAMIGSAFPGAGTATGAILGGLLGAGIGSGLGAAVTKYISRGVSYLFHADADEINPTNPEKYRLKHSQMNHIKMQDYNPSIIRDMMRAIRHEKRKLSVTASFSWSSDYEKNKQLNNLLIDIKNHPEKLNYPFKIGALYFDPVIANVPSPTFISSTAQCYQQTPELVPQTESTSYALNQTLQSEKTSPPPYNPASAPPAEKEEPLYPVLTEIEKTVNNNIGTRL